MPNHVTHRIVVTGPDAEVKRFLEQVIRPSKEDGQDNLDFQCLVPMPECVRNTKAGFDCDLGIEILTRRPKPDLFYPNTEKSILTYEWIRKKGIHTIDQLRGYAEQERPGALEAGQKALAAHQETGFYNWYDWSVANWGTKWPAYAFQWVSQTPHRLEFLFDTAWDTPGPIFEKLATEFPTLIIDVACFDECWNFAGRGLITNGSNDISISMGEATGDLYEYVYGAPPYGDEDDDDED